MTTTATKARTVNDIDLDALDAVIAAIGQDPGVATVAFRVATDWTGQTRSRSTVESCAIGALLLSSNVSYPCIAL